MTSLRRQPYLQANDQWHRLWWAVAMLAIALMPSSFRGGADVPHPHAFFQFWGQNRETVFAHHGAGHHVHSEEHAMVRATGTYAQPAIMTNWKPDLPEVTDRAAPGERATSISLLAESLLFTLRLEPWTPAQSVPGITPLSRLLGPEPPPPRTLAG